MTETKREDLEAAIREKHERCELMQATELAMEGYGREIYGYLVGVLRTHDDVFYILRRLNQTNSANHCPLARLFDDVTADVVIGTFNGLDHHGKRNAIAA